jgi:hypothetical protein
MSENNNPLPLLPKASEPAANAHDNSKPSNTQGDSNLADPKSLVCGRCWDNIFLSEKFAQVCWNISRVRNFAYSIRLRDVRSGANEGCSWCQMIRDIPNQAGKSAMYSKDDELLIEVEFSHKGMETTPPDGFHVFNLYIGFGEEDHSCFVKAHTLPTDPAAAFVKARPLQRVVNSRWAFEQAKSWIEECSFHENCPEPEEAPLPATVIEIKPEVDGGAVRLTQGQGLHGFYVALSYCWGEDQPGVTNLQNVSSRLKGIKPETLSKTIQDAIHCTRQLGIKYLWVDALCIIQDSPSDKVKQLGQMGSIYEKAIVTLFASSADRATKGFLEDRPVAGKDYQVPFPCPNTATGTVYLTYDNPRYKRKLEPINRRAWTLQERLLSPRHLDYATNTLQFSCSMGTLYLGESLNLTIESPIIGFGHFRPRKRLKLSHDRLRDILHDWKGVIYEYTRRELGREGDKLTALSGIAERFSQLLRTPYHAGLWEVDLLGQLIWRLTGPVKPRPKVYRAPTWSWASVDGHFWIERETFRVPYRSKVIEAVSVTESALAKFGAVTSAHLKISAPLFKAWFNPPSLLTWEYLDPDPSINSSHADTDSDSDPSAIYSFASSSSGGEDGAVGTAKIDTVEEFSRKSGWVYCAALVLAFPASARLKEYSDKVKVQGLILDSLDDRCTKFRRIGIFSDGLKGDFDNVKESEITIY